MDQKTTEFITRKSIAALIAIILGIFTFFNSDKLAGTILTLIGGLIAGIDPNIRSIILSLIEWILNKGKNNEGQNMVNSPNSIQQKAGRDNIVKQIIHNYNSPPEQESHSRQMRNQIKEEQALRDIREKMIKTLKIINDAANLGVRGNEKYIIVNDAVESFIDTKMKCEIDVDNEMRKKFNEVMGSFKKAREELFSNLHNGKLNTPLIGLNSFSFIDKVNEAESMIRTRLFG